MSAYNVTVDMPNLPRGEEVEISGLGRFKNGSTTEVSKEDAEAFRTFHQNVRFEHDENGALLTITEQGPTVLQANIPGVVVETVKEAPSKTETPDGDKKTTATKGGDK